MFRHLMVIIILFRLFCFINIGYQLGKVIVVIISSTNNSYVAFYNILYNISLYEYINFIEFLIIINFTTINFLELVSFCFQNVNAVSKILICLCSLTTQTLHIHTYTNKYTIMLIRLSNNLMKFSNPS